MAQADYVLNIAQNVELVRVVGYRNDVTENRYLDPDGHEQFAYSTVKDTEATYLQQYVDIPIRHMDREITHYLRIHRYQLADFIKHLQAVQSELTS